MFKLIRISILLFILLLVALSTWLARVNSVRWEFVLPVNIYLINGDGSAVAAEYLRNLTVEDFKPIEKFMLEEAERYGRASHASIKIRMGGTVESLPPSPPQQGSMLEVILWSLKMRWWAYRNGETAAPGTQVKMFLVYFDPAQTQRMAHSTGLQKGLLGLVNVFASAGMARQNNVVIAHEFLHTLGATDKYDAANQPRYPDGYAEPDLVPLHPQRFAEIMAGRTPLTQSTAETPASLDGALIGARTAQEINWLDGGR
ncbi:MAG TPA: hypothetical protein VGD24_03170 [Gallionella sp.]